jgi:DNA-binding protein YbaB
MKHEMAKILGKQTCDVIQMLEALGTAFNHNEDKERLQQVIAPAMKVAAHTLRPVLEALNLEEVTSDEGMKEACRR